MKIAYADPPYPGKANRYRENEEVDHAALIAQLGEYDGWALSTDETSLQYVLGLCPPGTRILAWCRPNTVPFFPYPYAAWEPVLCRPVRPREMAPVRSYAEITTVGGHMKRDSFRGQKPHAFCEWVAKANQVARHNDPLPGFELRGHKAELSPYRPAETTTK